ncbi:MAG: serine/threonine-protein kinase [Deltaproteobacteria bacterium]|nr:serine/threonine-protein kinase [Deltaproteobacteria bacterium]
MVSKKQWTEVRRLFHSALEVPPGERADYLASQKTVDPQVAEEVRELLELHEAPSSFLQDPLVSLSGDQTTGARIGPYEVRNVLGRGGMGTVYRGVRVDGAYRHQVAIKLLHPELLSAEVERRFRRERQILADLEHPSIARLLDGGTTGDGQPYLVLEFVEGVPIDEFCDREKLTVQQRLKLFGQVCRAVHFAHQNLVVHRDLKPGNILVTDEGQLKLLDFGIAKLLGAYDGAALGPVTGTAMAPMTPEFASPEQMRGKVITTACDVYALGNLLYLLLSGRRPFQLSERSPQQFVEAVCFEDPELPSAAFQKLRKGGETEEGRKIAAARGLGRGIELVRLEKALQGDLDNIVAKALRKDPRHRYLSAEELSLDVDRHLQGQPVMAREQTLGYRTWKFILRHRWPVGAAAAVLITFAAFTAALVVQQVEVLRERSHGQEVTRFLEGLFEISAPDRTRGERITVRELLDRGSADIRYRLADQPALRARLLATMGRVYRKLGLFDEAAPLVREALELRRQAHGGAHREVADSLLDLGDQALALGDYAEAQGHFEEGWEMLGQVGAVEGEAGVRALSGLSRAFQLQGVYDRAHQLRQQSLDLTRKVLGDDHPLAAVNQNELGGLLREQGDHTAAAEAYGMALDLYRSFYGERHPRVADLYNDLGLLYDEQGRFEDARDNFTKALAIHGEVYEADHPELATVRHNLAASYYGQGQLEEAEKLVRQAVESRRRALGERHPNVADSLNLLGQIRLQQGDLPGAKELLEEALGMWTGLLGGDFVKIGAARNNLSIVLRTQGDLEGAEEHLREALRIYQRTFGQDHVQVATVISNLALVHKMKGDMGAAREGYETSLEIFVGLLGNAHPTVATVSHNLAVVLEELGEPEAAEPRFRQALEALEESLAPQHQSFGVMRKNLASSLLAQGKSVEAEQELRTVLVIFEANEMGSVAGPVLHARGLLAESLVHQDRFPEAETLLLESYDEMSQSFGQDDTNLAKSRERLVGLYEAWGKPQKARRYR